MKLEKSLQSYSILEHIGQETFICHTVTHSYSMGLISSRDFVDLVKDSEVYIQPDLWGMLPQTVVEAALPNNIIDLVNSARAGLKAKTKERTWP